MKAFSGYKPAAATDCLIAKMLFADGRLKNKTELRQGSERNSEGVTEGRVEVQRVAFCQKGELRLVTASLTS